VCICFIHICQSRAKSHRLTLYHCFLILFLLLAASGRPLNRSCTNLLQRWQLGLCRKVRSWISKIFPGVGEGQKCHFSRDSASLNREWRKNGYTYQKMKLVCLGGYFLYQMLKTARTSVNGAFQVPTLGHCLAYCIL